MAGKTRGLVFGTILGCVLVCGQPPAGAASAIDTGGATIQAGTGTPTGIVEIDPAAPEVAKPALPPLGTQGTIGTITGSLPAFPGAGTGADGAFVEMAVAPETTHAGGTFHFTSYTVQDGGTVDYTSDAVIHVTGDVVIDGRVGTTAAGAGVEFRCGGNFTIVSRTIPARNDVHVSGAGASLTIHAAGDVLLGSGGTTTGMELRCAGGPLTVVAHGTITDGGDVITDRGSLVGVNQNVTVQAAQSLQFGAGFVSSGDGDTLAQAFGTDVTSASHFSAGDGSIRIEAAVGISFASGSADSSNGNTTLRALGGDMLLDDSTFDGEAVTVHAGGTATILDRTDLSGGTVELFAFGGDAIVGAAASRTCRITGDDQTVHGSRDVVFENGFLDSSNGNLTVRAYGRDVRVLGDSFLETSNGALDVRAAASIAFLTGGCIDGGSVHCSAGAGGINVEASEFRSDDLALDVLTSGPLRIRASVDGETGVTLRSTGGDIDLEGLDGGSKEVASVDIDTANQGAAPSGDILIEAWQPACILAVNADIRSGTSTAKSGDVRLLLHAAGAPEVRSFFLPKGVRVKLNEKKPEKSTLKAIGFFDVGPGNPDLSGAATLDVGSLSVTADLEVQPNGRAFRLRSKGFDFRVARQKSGSSRAKFRLAIVGDLAGQVPTEGDLTLRFRAGTVDGTGRVALENGKYILLRNRGALGEPSVFPFKAKATVRGAGKDALLIKAGVASDAPPTVAPETTVAFGGFSVTVPSNEFEDKGEGLFLAKAPPSAPGVKKLAVDYRRGLVTLKAVGVDLGTIPEGTFDVVLAVTLDDEERAVQVTATRKKKSVRY